MTGLFLALKRSSNPMLSNSSWTPINGSEVEPESVVRQMSLTEFKVANLVSHKSSSHPAPRRLLTGVL